jgi:hypothetical protein
MSHRLLHPLLLIGGLSGLASVAQAQGWLSLTPGDGKYAIDLPGKPEETRQTVNTAAGPADSHRFTLKLGDDEAFITSYSDFRPGAVTRPPAELMQDVEKGVLASLPNGKLRGHEAIVLDKYPGRAFVIELPDGTLYAQRVYLVGNRLYQNIAVTTGERTGDSRVKHFMESFRILKP